MWDSVGDSCLEQAPSQTEPVVVGLEFSVPSVWDCGRDEQLSSRAAFHLAIPAPAQCCEPHLAFHICHTSQAPPVQRMSFTWPSVTFIPQALRNHIP